MARVTGVKWIGLWAAIIMAGLIASCSSGVQSDSNAEAEAIFSRFDPVSQRLFQDTIDATVARDKDFIASKLHSSIKTPKVASQIGQILEYLPTGDFESSRLINSSVKKKFGIGSSGTNTTWVAVYRLKFSEGTSKLTLINIKEKGVYSILGYNLNLIIQPKDSDVKADEGAPG